MDLIDKELKKAITFRPDVTILSPECITNLRRLGERRELSKFLNKSIDFYEWYTKNPKGFLVSLVENNFEVIKHILRKVGRARNSNRELGVPNQK